MPPVNEPEPSPFLEAYQSYLRLPLITRWLIALLFVSGLGAGIGIFNPKQFVLIWYLIYKKYEIWRFFTAAFTTSLGMGFLMNLYFVYQYSQDLETSMFYGRKADYMFFLLFGLLSIDAMSIIAQQFQLLDLKTAILLMGPETMITYIAYIWSKYRSTQTVTFWFGIQFKAVWLPFVFVAYDFLSGDIFPIGRIVGIVVGHLYHFLTQVYPEQNGGNRLLQTPQFLADMFPEDLPAPPPTTGTEGSTSSGGSGGSSYAGINNTTTGNVRPRYTWGSGNRLGD